MVVSSLVESFREIVGKKEGIRVVMLAVSNEVYCSKD
jgi:hypothetical protein